MLNKPVYFISDNHFQLEINSDEKERRNRLYKVFNKIKITGGTLVIGGDFFDFWFYYPHMVPPEYADLMEELRSLNESGISIHFVLGNHDYWDFGYFQKKFNAMVYRGNLDFNDNGYNTQVCHGDGLLKNDVGYRFMKKIIRSRSCIFLFRNLHAQWGYSLAQKISKTSGHYHHQHDNIHQHNDINTLPFTHSHV